MKFSINIPCPVCKTGIPADTQQLLSGIQFGCPGCGVSIGLPTESKETVSNAMTKLESLRKQRPLNK